MKILLAIALAVSVGACSLIGGSSGNFDVCSAVSVVATQQKAIESAGMLVKSHPLSADKMAKIEQAYQTWADAQALAVTALVAVNDSGGNPSQISIQTYTEALVQIGVLAADFIAIYESFNPSSAPMMKGAPVMMATAAAVPCVIADADIRSWLAVPAWSAL